MTKANGQRLGCTQAGHRRAPTPGNCADHLCRPPVSSQGLAPSLEELPFPPPIHLATLWPLLQPEQAEGDRWREGCRQPWGGMCLQQSGGAGSPCKERVGEDGRGEGSTLVQVSQIPSPHACLWSSCTGSSLVVQGSIRFWVCVCREPPNKTQSLAARSFRSWQ